MRRLANKGETIAAEVAVQSPHGERKHHPASPSTLNARAVSTCFTPRQSAESNEAAERGTLQHEATDRGTDLETLSDEEANAVAECLALTNDLKADLAAAGLQCTEMKEAYLPIDDEIVVDSRDGTEWVGTTGGFADSILLWPAYDGFGARIEDTFDGAVFDWKFGRYAVLDAEFNFQGKAYYLGAVHWLAKHGLSMRNCHVEFRSPHRNEHPKPFVFTPEHIDKVRRDVVSIVHRSLQRNRDIDSQTPGDWQYADPALTAQLFKPSDGTCIFCDRLGWCPAVRDIAVIVGNKYRPIIVPNDIYAFSENDPESRASILKLGDLVEKWKRAVRTRITGQCVDDASLVPAGYSLSQSFPRRVLDPVRLRAFLVERFGEEFVAYHEELPLTPFEKYINDSAPRGEKKHEVARFADELLSAGIVEHSTTPVISLRMN